MHSTETTSDQSHAPVSQRIGWIDSAKGVAIALVVFAHVFGGLAARKWFGDGLAPRFLYDYIYLFHIPLFFMLSGALAIDTMRARPMDSLTSALRNIAWPYVVWGLVQVTLLPVVSKFMILPWNSSFGEGLRLVAMGHLSWFLWTLFFRLPGRR